MANESYFDLTSGVAGRGADLLVYLTEETTANTPELPAAADQITCNGDVNPEQSPEVVVSDARVSGSRAPAGGVQGPTDHGTCPIPFEWRPPLSADIVASPGAQYPMGHKVFKAFLGNHRTVNSQAALQITNVVSWSLAQCVITVSMGATDVQVGDGVALRVASAVGTPGAFGNGQIVGVKRVENVSSGVYRLTLTPGFQRLPLASGTPDYIRGLNTYYPDEAFRKRFSYLVKNGLMGRGMSGGIVNKLSAAFDRREIFKLMADYEFRAMDRCASDAVRTHLTASATTIPTGTARKFVNNPSVQLIKVDNATGNTLATEGPLRVSSTDVTNNAIVVDGRAGGTVFTNSASDLTVATNHGTSVETGAGTYDISTKRYLRIRIDGRDFVNMDLQSPTAPSNAAAATATEIVNNINANLLRSQYYGRPFQGMLGGELNYGAAASVTGVRVRITSLMWGSASRIEVVAIGDGTTSAHNVIFTGAFSKQAPYEIQIQPYTPTPVTEEREIMHAKEGVSTINGYTLPTTGCTVDNGNGFEWFENVRNGSNFVAGGIAGKLREPSADVSVDANGWTDQLDYIALNNEDSTIVYQVAGDELGSGFAIGWFKSKVSTPKASGDNRVTKQLTVKPEKSVNEDNVELAEMYIWNC